MRIGFGTPIVAFFATAITGAAGWLVSSAIRDQKRRRAKAEYPRNVLETDGAVSAVTGGHPEEMNEMPPGVAELKKATPRPTSGTTSKRKAS